LSLDPLCGIYDENGAFAGGDCSRNLIGEINLSWGKVAVEITTNDRGGLTELDFSFAENVNKLV